MDFQEFVCAVEQKMNMELKNGITARGYTAVKNNGNIKQGIMMNEPDINISPAIYLEEFYLRFQKGETIDKIVCEILDFYESVKVSVPVDKKDFLNIEKMKDKIVFKIIYTQKNLKLLQNIPHLEILDLSVVFYLLLERSEEGIATIQITNEHLENWKMEPEKLYELAIKNAQKVLPAEFCSMSNVIREVSGLLDIENNIENQEETMYVLSNSIRSYGAACIFYPHLPEMIGEILKEDYYILPSSVHELIIVPKSKGMPKQELDEMIQEINQTQLEPEEILSDHAYYYERSSGQIRMFFS